MGEQRGHLHPAVAVAVDVGRAVGARLLPDGEAMPAEQFLELVAPKLARAPVQVEAETERRFAHAARAITDKTDADQR